MQQDDRIQKWCALGLLALVVAITLLGLRMSFSGPFYTPSLHAQMDPAERQWFRSQKVPGQNYRCCDEADGTYAEEELRGGKYWTRFTWRHYGEGDLTLHEVQSDWMEVPEAAVIHDANRHGAPTVWWSWQGGYGADAKVFIRCYAPGAGL